MAFLLKNSYYEAKMGVRNERRGSVFIRKTHHQLLDKAADVWQP
jgi:hypothetical protein